MISTLSPLALFLYFLLLHASDSLSFSPLSNHLNLSKQDILPASYTTCGLKVSKFLSIALYTFTLGTLSTWFPFFLHHSSRDPFPGRCSVCHPKNSYHISHTKVCTQIYVPCSRHGIAMTPTLHMTKPLTISHSQIIPKHDNGCPVVFVPLLRGSASAVRGSATTLDLPIRHQACAHALAVYRFRYTSSKQPPSD